jgi:hypothetical protein
MLTTVSSASAALVNFRGVLTGNPISGGTLSLPLNTPFLGSITTGAPIGNFAIITGGFLDFNGTILTINGGAVTIPTANTLQFVALSNNPPNNINVTTSFSFTGVSGLGSVVDQSAFDALYPPVYTSNSLVIFQTDGGSNVLASYGGSVSSVPEPGSVLALCGLVAGAGAWRLRRRKVTTA